MEEFERIRKEKAQKSAQNASGRKSVSAEVFGDFNKKVEYVPKVVTKTEEQKEVIRARLSKAFMFKMLEESEKKIVIDAMEEKKVAKGEHAIKQGDDGDVLYLVDTGTLECFKERKGEDNLPLLTYNPGMAFGE